MGVAKVSELSPEVAVLVTEYLEAVSAALASVDAESAGDMLEDVSAHICEALSAHSTTSAAQAVIDGLGEPSDYAAGAEIAPSPACRADHASVLGMPYEMRLPTGERVVSSWWNPADTRLFVPRVFGLGWDLNMGALAVRLSLIEPDGEDEPFASVPDRAFVFAFMVPVALTLAVLLSYLLLQDRFGAQLPVHFDWKGTPDRFASKAEAFGMLAALTTLPTLWAGWLILSGRSRLARGGAVGLASLMSAMTAAVWAATAASGLGLSIPGWVFVFVVVFALAVPMAVFTVLARLGRAVEVRRDLEARAD